MSSQFIIQYHDAILNPGLFTWCCWATNRQVFNIKYCSHHHNHMTYIYIYICNVQVYIIQGLLICGDYFVVCTTPSWKWSSLEYEGFSDSTWRLLWLATWNRLLMWWHFIRQAQIYWVLGNKEVWISVVRLFDFLH